MSHQGDWTYWDSQFVAWADITEDERAFHIFAEFTIIGRCLGNKWERKEKAGMVSLPSNLGHGERWYWVCPRCQRRCKSLYLRPDDFRPWCRRCHRLVNRSTQENRRIPGGIIGYLRADGIIEDHYDKVYKRWDKRNKYRRMKARLLREAAEKSGNGSVGKQ